MSPQSPRRMRSASVTLGVTALVAAALTGCSPAADNRAVCVDPATQKRVADASCDDSRGDYTGGGTGGYYWYYLRSGSRAPAVGGSYATSGGTFDSHALSGTTTRGGVSSDGGSVSGSDGVSRGGFGGSHHIGS
ncbi:hypothetical protein [Xylanimonas sp. McL0601]|uniref:hypothetical protein n=1 Tax=Xylanimonas sp. McL0601 TaxID=3414739 RepID=UPI003CFA784B